MLIGGTVATVGLSFAGVGLASAASSTTSPQASIIDKLVTRFHLNKDDVTKVFDENRTEREAAREAEMKTRLDQAVKDGKLTQAQEDALIAKQTEMKTFMDTLKGKTQDERRAAMKTKMDEFKQWITDNKIPQEFARPGFGRGHGPGGPGDMGPPPDSASSSN